MNLREHAVATDGPDNPPSPEELDLVEKLCREVVRRRMAIPALVFLEMSQPLGTLTAQVLHFLSPVLGMFTTPEATSDPATAARPTSQPFERLSRYLERPGAIGQLADRIEFLEKEREAEANVSTQEPASPASPE